MQPSTTDSRNHTPEDDFDDVFFDDEGELEIDPAPTMAKPLVSPKELLARRRRAEDLLEAKRLREELGDDSFSF